MTSREYRVELHGITVLQPALALLCERIINELVSTEQERDRYAEVTGNIKRMFNECVVRAEKAEQDREKLVAALFDALTCVDCHNCAKHYEQMRSARDAALAVKEGR